MNSYQVIYHASEDGSEGGCWYSARSPWAALLLDIASLSLSLPAVEVLDDAFKLTYSDGTIRTGYINQAR